MLFADLQPSTKAVYHVITRIKNHHTNKFFWKMYKIAEQAGVSYMSVRRAEAELESAGAIQYIKRLPHSKEYKFLKEIPLVDNYESDQSSMNNQSVHPRTMSLFTHEQCKQQIPLNRSLLTTTDVNVKKYHDLVKEYGKELVDVVVESVKKRNGSVRNLTGYVIHALKNGYVPKTQEQIEQERKDQKRKMLDEDIGQSRREHEEIERLHNQSDPEAGKKAMQEFLAKIGE